MKLGKKDLIATLLIAVVVVPYVGYLIWGEMPFIQDPRGMAAVGIVGLAPLLRRMGTRAAGPCSGR